MYKVFYTIYGKKKSIIIKSSSTVGAANRVLRELTNSFNKLGEIEVYYVRQIKG